MISKWQLPVDDKVAFVVNCNQCLLHGDAVVYIATLVYSYMTHELMRESENVSFSTMHGFQWFTLFTQGGYQRLSMVAVVLNGYQWLSIVSSGYQWFPCSGSQWSPVVLNGYQWWSIVSSGFQWFTMVTSGFQ